MNEPPLPAPTSEDLDAANAVAADNASDDAADNAADNAADSMTDTDPEAAAESAPAGQADSESIDLDAIERDLTDVQSALERLNDGSYWTDEITGNTIPDEVLATFPLTRTVAGNPADATSVT